MWLPVLETLPAPEWFGTGPKLGYIVVVRLVETVLGNVFLWAGTPFYGVYVTVTTARDLAAGGSGLAGSVMMLVGSFVTTAIAWLFLRLAEEGEVRQGLIERASTRGVRRAVRYRRWQELGGQRPLMTGRGVHHRRPRRLFGRAQPALLPRAARAARLHARRRGRRGARRDDLVHRRRRHGRRRTRGADASGGYDRYRVGVHPRRVRGAPPAKSSTSVTAGRSSAARRSRARPRSTTYIPGYYAFFFYDPDGIKLEIVHVPA